MIKYIVYSLICASFIGVYFTLDKGITYADVFCPILSLFALFGLVTNRWHLDNFCRINIGYAAIMAFASILNLSFTNTVFINYFRIYLYGIVIYCCTYNSIRSKRDLKKFLFIIFLFFLYFLVNLNTIVQFSFEVGEGDYSSLSNHIIYGRNSLGFTAILFSLLSLFLYSIDIIKIYMCSAVLLSASRFSVIAFIIILVYFLIVNSRQKGVVGILKSIVIMIAFPLLAGYLFSFVSSDVLSTGIDLLTGKMEVIDSDVEDVRIFAINVRPILNWMADAKIINYIIGDGSFIGHSIFAHTLISTGIIGLIYYMYTNIKYLTVNFLGKTVFNKFTFLVVSIMIMNDFITNSRFIILLNNMLFMLIVAFISKSKIIYFYRNNS